ncbi:MAG: energy-coupling factor transporter transmembrane protein EcfT [Oscillospiraceae bacterium]|nr:energy-coupling factor transporter transmembrane protein EcfT [Oscillospiraceae bacterium]
MRRIYAQTVHPACILLFYIGAIGFTLACHHPVIVSVSFVCACLYLAVLGGGCALWKSLRFALLLMIVVSLFNPIFNRRGTTLLFMLGNNWVTLESTVFGVVSGIQLASIIVWSGSYMIAMTSDRFLYLFGKAAPSASLLITMTQRFIPTIQLQIEQICTSQQMLNQTPKRVLPKMNAAVRNISALLSWSMENAVEMADSMKARGYGIRRRTTFHLFRFDSRDSVILCLLLLLSGICALARLFGHGRMEFFPDMTLIITGVSGIVMYSAFALMALLPTFFEISQKIKYARIFPKGDPKLGSVRI